MPAAAAVSVPLAFIHGDDDFAVKQRARQLYQQWSSELGGMDHEIIDAQVSNSTFLPRKSLRECGLPFISGNVKSGAVSEAR